MDIIAYTYCTINPFNGKLYIGFHKHNGFDSNYKGSGKLIRRAFEKYGWDNFKCYMIKAFDDLQEAYDHECYLIEKYRAAYDPKFYNLQGGHRYRNAYYRVKDDDGNEIIVSLDKASEYFKKNGYIKRKYTIRDLVWVNDGENNYLVPPDEFDDYIGKGFSKGMTEAHNEKTGASIRGKVAMHYEDKEGYFFVFPEDVERLERDGAVKGKGSLINGRIRINNGIEEALVYPEELNDPKYSGWVHGNIDDGRHTYNHVCATKGKKAMHWDNPDGTVTSFFISEHEIERYLNEGAKIGRGITTTKGLTYVNDGKRNRMVPPEEVPNLILDGYKPGKLSVRWFAIKDDEVKQIGLRQVPKYKELGYDIKEETIVEEVS